MSGEGGSAARRWAQLVTKMTASPIDPRTLEIWGRFAGVSVSTLRSRCSAIGVGAKASLDFTRLLRALVRSARMRSNPLLELDVQDLRTIRRLFASGGLGDPYAGPSLPSLPRFMEAQRLVSSEEALRCVTSELRVTPSNPDHASLRRG